MAAALLVVTGCDGQLWVVAPEQPPVLSGTDAGMGPTADAASAPIPDAFTPPQPDAYTPPPPPVVGCDNPIEQEVIRLANEARAAAGVGPLTCDPTMTAVARAHSTDMCMRDYFSHTGLDGRSPFDRMRDGGVRYSTAGENIAWGQRSASEVHTAWMNSSGHRRNILNGAFGRIGVGLDPCGGRNYWTQIFAD